MMRSVRAPRRLHASAVRRRGTDQSSARWSPWRTPSATTPAPDTWTRSSPSAQSSRSARDCPDGVLTRSIPNFIPDDLLVDEAVPCPDGPIVFVGDLSRDKGIEVLIEAHRRLGGLPRLVLAGRVFEDTPLDLPDQVELRGLLDHASVIDLIRGPVWSSFPRSFPTAVRRLSSRQWPLGRPVVAAASGGIVDLVDDGVTGLLVAPGDPVALSNALSTVVNDRDDAAAMGRRALDRARSFTASAVVGRIEQLYEQLVSRPRRRG